MNQEEPILSIDHVWHLLYTFEVALNLAALRTNSWIAIVDKDKVPSFDSSGYVFNSVMRHSRKRIGYLLTLALLLCAASFVHCGNDIIFTLF